MPVFDHIAMSGATVMVFKDGKGRALTDTLILPDGHGYQSRRDLCPPWRSPLPLGGWPTPDIGGRPHACPGHHQLSQRESGRV